MSHKTDREHVATTHNVARYFTETRHVAWVLLIATLVLGGFGYARMPKRKDPFIKVRTAVAVCAWPGAAPAKVEELITRRIEEKIAQNGDVDRVESTSRTGVSVVTVTLRDSLPIDSIPKTFDDIDLRLRSVRGLPAGSSPIEFQKDFGDTAALMLTVATPKVRDAEIALRARSIMEALAAERAGLPARRSAIILSFPASLESEPIRRAGKIFGAFAEASGRVREMRPFEGAGFFALDATVQEAGVWASLLDTFLHDQVTSTVHPELWPPIIVDGPSGVEAALTAAPGNAYTYRELDDMTDQISLRLRSLSSVARVTRAGVLAERVYLNYSQERLAALGLRPDSLSTALAARNLQAPSAVLDANGRTVAIDTSGEFKSEKDVGDTLLTTTGVGSTVYLRDVLEVSRDYEAPPLYVNYYTGRDKRGEFQRSPAITLAVQMRPGEQIGRFSKEVDAALTDVAATLPEDILAVRTSDQARQVDEKIDLFMSSLWEAIVIIVIVGFAGFREWRSATLLALSIPLTLGLTFLLMAALDIDIQQMSLAALILALGLLVDDPVVAGDAIKRELDDGKPRKLAAWLGPTRLARAIMFATITNIVAYLPFLLFGGDVGHFVYSLPVVLACSLVASRLVSMTFIPLLGYTLLRATKAAKAPSPTRELVGFAASYRRFVSWAIDRRYKVLGASLVVILLGGYSATRLKRTFFPKDHSRLFYVDIFLPEDSGSRATSDVAIAADHVIRETAQAYSEAHGGRHGAAKQVLHSITSFIGGGAPRFWYSLAPQQRQLNYAQLVVEVEDENDTVALIPPLQDALTSQVAGAHIDVRQLENGKPVPRPVEVRFAGEDPATLRALADKAKAIFRAIDLAERVRDDWGEDSFRVTVDVDPARAKSAGVSNVDIASASAGGFNGIPTGTLRDGDKVIPIVARLRYEERGNAGDIRNLYVIASRGGQKVPLGQVAQISYQYAPEKIQRRNQRRTISAFCFPTAKVLPSEVMNIARAKLEALRTTLPPGYAMDIGGAEENVKKVQGESALIAAVSLSAILLTLVIQFRHAVKPLLVFAAIPYGVSGALIAIAVMGAPFGFTAILGVISLIGVIVSHVIVLFDYIEEAHEKGESLHDALLDAGTLRLRPVLITVGATVLGLVPLALHGGPLWEPLCYAQIGGLTLATMVTLVLVPILYAVFVLDLKWIKWGGHEATGYTGVMKNPMMPLPSPALPDGPTFSGDETAVMAPRDAQPRKLGVGRPGKRKP